MFKRDSRMFHTRFSRNIQPSVYDDVAYTEIEPVDFSKREVDPITDD